MSTETEENDEYVKRWKMKQLCNKLELAKGNGTNLISLMIPQGAPISKATQLLAEEYGSASSIKSSRTRNSVLSALRASLERIKLYKEIPSNGLIIYAGIVIFEDGKERKMVIDMEPFKPLRVFKYLCDNKFHVEPLREMLQDNRKYGFIIVDGNGALYGIVSGTDKKVLAQFSEDLPKKHSKGGQSSMRFARTRLEKRHNYLRKVAETATSVFIENDLPNVEGLFLAGSSEFKKKLAKSEMFDKRLKTKVINVFDLQYGGETGFNQAILLARGSIQEVELTKQSEIICAFFEEIDKDTGKFCYGINDTMYALETGAVKTLIVWEDLQIRRIELINPLTQKKHVRYVQPDEELSQEDFYDADATTELEINEDVPLVEYLAERYKDYGTRFQLVSDKSTEGAQFAKGFGGIGGIMRFALEFARDGDEEDLESLDSEETFM